MVAVENFAVLQRSASTGMITVVVSISYLLAPSETYLFQVQRSYSNNEPTVFAGTVLPCFSRELWQQAAGKKIWLPCRIEKKIEEYAFTAKLPIDNTLFCCCFLDLSKTCEKRGQQGFLVSSHGDWYG